MSCLENITQLREQQATTLRMYQELYDSFISTPGKAPNSSIARRTNEHDGTRVNLSSYFNDTQNVTDMITEASLDSTCDVPRLESQNTTITEMWNNFTIDKYAPRQEVKKITKALTAPPLKKSKPRIPRVTVPDPFYMTLREELLKPGKSKVQEEYVLQKLQDELEAEAECRKQFKASPIPASTFGSKLKEIQDTQEARRHMVKECSKALTKALQKPFSFDTRQTLRRSRSLSALDGQVKKMKSENQPKFYARPMPYHIFDPEVDEKAREEEAYRQIKIKMRAEQLLADSDLPSSMKRHGLHYTDGRIRRQIQQENEKIAHLTEEHTFRPAIKDYVPDYYLLHKQQEEELLKRQILKPTTVIEPFNLRTEQIARARTPPTPDVEPTFRRSPCLYTAVCHDEYTSKPTVSSALRNSATRQKILADKKKEQAEYEVDITNRLNAVYIQKDISQKSRRLDPTVGSKERTRVKLRQKIEEQKKLELEYKEQLSRMQEKLKERPFLFERATADTARISAERTFRNALLDAGVDPTLVEDISKYEEDSLMVS